MEHPPPKKELKIHEKWLLRCVLALGTLLAMQSKISPSQGDVYTDANETKTNPARNPKEIKKNLLETLPAASEKVTQDIKEWYRKNPDQKGKEIIFVIPPKGYGLQQLVRILGVKEDDIEKGGPTPYFETPKLGIFEMLFTL